MSGPECPEVGCDSEWFFVGLETIESGAWELPKSRLRSNAKARYLSISKRGSGLATRVVQCLVPERKELVRLNTRSHVGLRGVKALKHKA